MKTMERTPPFALEDWIVEPQFHRISQGSTSHRIEPKVMSVLLRLAAQPNHVVSKDEILQAVWPDTYVGEDALTRCVSVLRHVLEDDPHHPRFIKTISKVGYCLLMAGRPLDEDGEELPAGEFALASPIEATTPVETPYLQPTPASIPAASPAPSDLKPNRMSRSSTALIVLVAASAGLTWALVAYHGHRAPAAILTSRLTTAAGEQSRPALSPDGRWLAFVWEKDDGSRQHVYIKEVGSQATSRLTNLAGDEYSPAWSPDGRHVAFLYASDAGLALYVGTPGELEALRKIYIPGETTRWEQGALGWSPDGQSFVLADHLGAQPSSSIFVIDVQTLHAQPVTTPPSGWEGDLSPVYSPDGTKIAFVRASESAVGDIYWISAAGGEPHRVTHDGKMINGLAWSSDNRAILFSSNRAGEYALWKVPLDAGTPQRMPVGTEDATQPAAASTGKKLAFVEGSAIFGILQVQAAGAKGSLLISSTAQDSAPSVSPDGTQFAFQSWRSGSQQIWVSSVNGQTLRQLTPDGSLSGSGSPAWSPGGDQILFDSRVNGHSHIFVAPASGGSIKQITFGDVNDIVPRWSRDGRSIYFRSNRGGRWQLWKLSAADGMPQPLTSDDGMVGQESPDGKWLYFARGGENGIWRMPAAGGNPVKILEQPPAGYWAYWVVGQDGIYFLDQAGATPAISLFDPASGRVTTFAKLDRLPPWYSGISLLPNGKGLLISDKSEAGSHISMAQGEF